MNIAAIHSLFDYNYWVNQRILEDCGGPLAGGVHGGRPHESRQPAEYVGPRTKRRVGVAAEVPGQFADRPPLTGGFP